MDQVALPKVFTIPGSYPFLDSLAKGLRDQFNSKAEALSSATVLLPTRRACRALRDAFLRESGGNPVLLPQLLPLGDIDEDELQISTFGRMNDGIEIGGQKTISIPPAIPRLRREILLARLILANPHSVPGPDQAVRLARELARLLDQVHTEQLSFDRLKDLVPDDFAGY